MKRIAIYARVSTEHEAQISALENQIQYYDEILQRHKDWILYDRYIDEGITGTSVDKRKNFIRMMEDAREKKFDLVVTREVSRFARNTVDTLQQTRILKSYGVEVWFTEDNIWTMNDEDGELRLSIMATLAQNESKKISSRVKAGQKISFLNGVLYGNGNILGYDRCGKNFIINEEQAETVRRIYELYLAGNGCRKIQFILESEGRKTAMGNTNWSFPVISRIINNPFYCGRVEYRKQYVPDYLSQKKVNNKGEVEKIIVKGTHQPIISEEDFEKAQCIKKQNTIVTKEGVKGKPVSDYVWVRKLRCNCGSSFNRRSSYTTKDGTKKYTYQCYHQKTTGSITTRTKRGLSIEGVCDNNSFPEWKLDVQADFIFRKLLRNKQEIYDEAMRMLGDGISNETNSKELSKQIERNIREIDKYKARIDALLDMRLDGDISKESYNIKKASFDEKIGKLEIENKKLKNKITDTESQDNTNTRLEIMGEFLKMEVFSSEEKIPETIIETYVEKVVYYKGKYTWQLRPKIGNTQEFTMTVDKNNKENNIPEKNHVPCLMLHRQLSTAHSNNKSIVLGTFNIPRSYAESVIGYYSENSGFYFRDEITMVLELI